MNNYLSGTLVKTSAAFVDSNGNPADPTTVTLKLQVQGSVANTYTYGSSAIVKDSVGNYHYIVDTTGYTGAVPQLQAAEWDGVGAIQVPGYDQWTVTALPI